MDEKIILRDPINDKPENYQICFILPHYRKAEYIDGFFINGNEAFINGNEAFINVEKWFHIKEISARFDVNSI